VYPRCRLSIFVCLLFCSFLGHAQESYRNNFIPIDNKTAVTSIAKLPLVFEPNVGQGPSDQTYLTLSGIMQVGFTPDSIEVQLPSAGQPQVLGMTLVNARADVHIAASDKGAGESNYLLGDQPSTWKTHVPQYGRLTYGDVYPGVNLTFYGKDGRVEHDFVVQPGADYRRIKLRYRGARKLKLAENGDLRMAVGDSEVIVRAPYVYQDVLGHRRERDGKFVLLGADEVSFQVSAFDPTLPLVIDPILDYSTYLADQSLSVEGAAVDAAGNTYIVGLAFSSTYPITASGFQTTCSSCASNKPDIFITKLNAVGTAQVYSTFLGGSDYDQPWMITVDTNGNAIVAGYTASADFPLKNAIPSGTASSQDGFVASLAPDGASLNFSSRLGGSSSQAISGTTLATAVTTDATGNVYVSGTTESPSIPVTPGALNAGTPSYANNYVFLAKLQASGSLVYSAIVGATGMSSQCCTVVGMALDSDGNTYLAGTVGVTPFTNTTPWPTTSGAYQATMISPGDAAPFVAKVSDDASTLLYSTLVTTGIARGMALTPDHQVILVGNPSFNYPVTPDAYSSMVGTSFIAKLSADASQLSYSTYFSTATLDTGGYITNVALDSAGDVWVAGNTGFESNVPMMDPLQSVPGSTLIPEGSAFISEFDPSIHQLLFSTYFNGAQGGSRIAGLAIDNQGNAHIVGTGEDDLPVTPTAYLGAVTPPPPNFNYTYGFAAVINPNIPGPGICFSDGPFIVAPVGSSGNISLTITNCGSAPLNISSVQLTSPIFALSSSGSCVGTLAPNAMCTIGVTFTPAATGTFSTALTVSSNATIPTYNIPVTAIGTAPKIGIQPASGVFSPQVYGDSATASNILIFVENRGTAPLIVQPSQAAITGDFNIVSNDCGNPVQPPASPTEGFGCTFTIAFSPSALGPRTGTLTIASNDSANPIVTVPLSGTAVAAYTTPTVTSLSVPSVAMGSAPFTLQIFGTNFFPTSSVVINGITFPTTFNGAGSLTVSFDPSNPTHIGELPVSVINPSPGGQSNSIPLTVFQSLPISAASLVYSPATQMLYASIPASATTNSNTVLPIDPVTGNTGTPIAVGNDPGKLALSSDGVYLYVGLNGDHSLQRINLSTAQVERTFTLPVDRLSGPTTVNDMHGVPGAPKSVVASLSRPASPSEAGAALFTDSGLSSYIANTFNASYYSVDSFAFTSSPSPLYALPFSGNFFGETGVSATTLNIITGAKGETCCDQTTGSLVASDGQLLYTNSGQVWDPHATTLLGTYTPSSGPLFFEPAVVPDTANNRTFMLDTLGGTATILSFDQTTYKQVASLFVPLQSAISISDLYRWGADGFAFRSYSGRPSDAIIILRSSIVPTVPNIAASPSSSSLTFAAQTVNTTSAAQTVTLTNSGNTTLTISSIAASTDFAETNTCGASLAVGANCTITVTFTPTATGERTGTLTITDNASNSPQTVTLDGTGTAPQSATPAVTLSANSLTFDPQTVGTTSPAQTMTLTNSGNAALTITSITASGDFAETNTCSAILAAGTSCTISVTFSPTATGTRTGTLTITDDASGSPQTVALNGGGSSVAVSSGSSGLTMSTAGGSATATIQLSAVNGFSGTVNLACAVSYQGQGSPTNLPTCSLNPAQVQVTGSSPVSSTLIIATTAASASAVHKRDLPKPAIALAALLFFGVLPRRRWRGVILAVLCLVTAGVVIGCGGGSSGSGSSTPRNPGTLAGSYQVTITATSGTASTSVTIPITIQ
jgi:Abnormal spindle-like microcephaly-assoc'd, ASPM-SPD-2-Hydin